MTNNEPITASLGIRAALVVFSWADQKVCYQNANWTEAEKAAFRKGWEGGKK